MGIISYIYNRLSGMFSSRESSIRNDLETVFGESQIPSPDPNRGTAFWTSGYSNKLRTRITYFTVAIVIIIGIFVAQLWKLQIQQGAAFAIESVHNTLSQTLIFPQRGTILDRNNSKLAWNTATETLPFFARSYATSSGFGHLLGYVKYPQQDNNGNFYREEIAGQAGVERQFQDVLAGQVGTKIVESTALGNPVSESIVNPPSSGNDIKLSIDAEIQKKLFSLIRSTAEERGFAAGAGVIMEVDSGKILAATDYPEYDSNALTEGQDGYVQQLTSDNSQPFLSRVGAGRYTPGSVIKPFIAVAALAEDVVEPNTTIVSTGSLRVENPYQPGSFSIFPDWKRHGPVAIRDALAVSSNEYFYQIGGGYQDQPGLGISKIAEYSQAFGLGEETGIRGMPEVDGVIPTPEWKRNNFSDGIWRLGDTYHTAIGQYGYQVTPLQMSRAMAGIATSGNLPVPTVWSDTDTEIETVNKSINSSDYQVVREGMRQAVTDGTASGLNVDYLDVAAKTGTAELGGENSGLNSWIAGFFPYEDPRYSFTIVMADGPRNNTVGGVYVMRQLLDWMRIHHPEYLQPDN